MKNATYKKEMLEEVIEAQPKWFSKDNMRFFGDLCYYYDEYNNHKWLIRKTEAWTDMFGAPKQVHYRVNYIDDNLKIGSLCDEIFETLQEARDYCEERSVEDE